MSRSLRVFVMAVACVLSLCTRAAAQVALPAAVRIQVVDSTGRPLANADVSVLEGMSKVIAKGITDMAGVRTLVIPSAGEYQVVVWRLGFLRSSQFFTATAGSIALRVPLTPSAIPLPTITVTADADVNRKAYHIDADGIAASERPLFDGYDVLSKLRPEMIDARTPSTFINKRLAERCTIQDVWVNGQRISFAPSQDDRLAMKKYYHMRASMTGSGIASVPINVLSVLGSIHPEHIDEINYTDCNNFTSTSRTVATPSSSCSSLASSSNRARGRTSTTRPWPLPQTVSASLASSTTDPANHSLASISWIQRPERSS